MSTAATTPSPNKERRHKSSFLQEKAALTDAAYSYHDSSVHNSSGALSAAAEGEGIGEDIHSDVDSIDNTHNQQQHTSTAPPSPGGSYAYSNTTTARTNKTDADLDQIHRQKRKIARQIISLQKQLFELRDVTKAIMTTYIYNNAEQQLNLPDTMRLRCEKHFSEWCIQLTKAGVNDTGIQHIEGGGSFNIILESSTTAAGSSFGSCSVGASGETPAHSPKPVLLPMSSVATILSSTDSPNTTTATANHGNASSTTAGVSISISGNFTNNKNNRSITVDTILQQYNYLDLSFTDLFKETKAEILKLLRDDKFPRWKTTADFQTFIASIKPYNIITTPNSNGSHNKMVQGMDMSVISNTE